MPININQVVDIDPSDPVYIPLLEEIQGNILTGHNRDYTAHLLLTFNSNVVGAKQWLGSFANQYVTSALAQSQQGTTGTFANLLFSMSGYMHLQFPYGSVPSSAFFRAGMKDPNTQRVLGDPAVSQWEGTYQNELHALVLVADNDLAALDTLVQSLQQQLADITAAIHIDRGFVMRNPDGQAIEHFGFRDGISQPLFLKSDIDQYLKEQGSFANWDPRAPLNLVLFKDPLGTKPVSYGSYLVYRKLQKNVPGWKENVQELATELAIEPALAGALAMGRFEDGTPVTLKNTATAEIAKNNFNYQGDQQGSRCPFHAHARKTNPRGDTKTLTSTPVPLEEEKMHRIIRRGSSYGATSPETAQATGSGSLFLCFMADIMNQFNFMQQVWSNSKDFVERGVGSDPVIGVEKLGSDGKPVSEGYQWPSPWGTTTKKSADFTHWVNFQGGEYFFAPSLSFLRSSL